MSREDIIKAIAEDMSIAVEEVEKVITWSYMQANKAVREGNEVEISGFCKFYLSKAKVKRRIEKIERSLSDDKSEKRQKQLKEELDNIKNRWKDVETV